MRNCLITIIATIYLVLSAQLVMAENRADWRNEYVANQHQKPFETIAFLKDWIVNNQTGAQVDGEAYYRLVQLYLKVGKKDLAKQIAFEFESKTKNVSSESSIWLGFIQAILFLADVNAKDAKGILDIIREQVDDSEAQVKAIFYLLEGQQRSLSSLYEEAIIDLNQAQTLAEKIDDSLIKMGVLSHLVNIQYYMQQYQESLATNHQLRELAVKYQDDFYRMFTYSNEMNIYYMLATQQSEIASNSEDEKVRVSAEQLSDEYIAKSNEFRSLLFEQAESIGAFKPLLRAMIQLQNQYLREENYLAAVEASMKAVDVAEKYNSEYEKAVSYNNMSIAYRAIEKYQEAIKALEEADKVYTKLQHKQSMLWSLEDFSIIYELQGNYEKALEYYKQLHTDSMSLIRTTNSEKVLELQKIYETEKNQQEIERLNQENLLVASEIRVQKILISFGVVFLILIGFGLFYMYSRNKIIAVKNHKLDILNKKLKEQALRDPLTKLHNRRFISEIQDKLSNSVARRVPLTETDNNKIGLVLLDIDHFKSINDQYGHDVGDDILIQISNDLSLNLREGDIAVRWGGEEFLIVLLDTNIEGVKVFCERMLAIRNESSINIGKEKIAVTMSMGYGVFPFSEQDQHLLSWDESIKLVDNLLYIAKESGRNQAVSLAVNNNNDLHEKKKIILKLDKEVNESQLAKQDIQLNFIKP